MDMNHTRKNILTPLRTKAFKTGLNWFIISFLFFIGSLSIAQKNSYLIHTFKKHSEPINSVDIHPEKKLLVTGSKDRKIIVWDIQTKKELLIIDDNNAEIQSVAFSPDGKYLLGSVRNIIKVWTVGGEYINSMKGHATAVWSIDFNTTGDKMVTGSFDRSFRLWNFSDLTEIFEYKGHSKSVLSIAFHPNGKIIASASLDETIRLWSIEQNQMIATLKGHSGNIYSIDFSPSGKYLLSASLDNTIKLWDVDNEELVKTFEGHSGAVFDVKFTQEEEHFLSGSLDKTIKLWEISTGNCIYTYTGHEGNISSLAFLPDGKSFVSGSYDQTAKLWRFSPEVFVDYYFRKDIESEMKGNSLFDDKSKGESRQDYSARMEEAKILKDKLYQKYYQLYLERLKNNSLNNKE